MTAISHFAALKARIRAQIEREESFERQHKAAGDMTKARTAQSTATVLRRILRETDAELHEGRLE